MWGVVNSSLHITLLQSLAHAADAPDVDPAPQRQNTFSVGFADLNGNRRSDRDGLIREPQIKASKSHTAPEVCVK